MPPDRVTIRNHMLEKVKARGVDKSICPSEVARALGGEAWRSLMEEVRSVGAELVDARQIVAMQKGQIINPRMAKGPIRYRVTDA